MSINVIEEFFVALGFQVDTAGLEQMQTATERAQKKMLGFVSAVTAAASAIGIFTIAVADNLDNLGDFAERENVAIESIQELGHAAQLEGSSLDSLKSSIEGLNRVTGEAANGFGRGAKAFATFGLSATGADGKVKSFDVLLGEIADKMKGLSRQQQISMAEKLGLNRDLIPLLSKGSARLKELTDEAKAFGVASKEDAAAASALTDSVDRLRYIFGQLGTWIAVRFMPIITRVTEGFRKWFILNQDLIKQRVVVVFEAITKAAGFLFDWTVKIVSGFVDLVKWLGRFKIATYAAIAALSAFVAFHAGTFFIGLVASIGKVVAALLSLNLALTPWVVLTTIIGALVIGIGLLIDDFQTFQEGGDSVIGDLIKKFPVLLDIVSEFQNGFKSFVNFWTGLKLDEPIAELLNSFSLLGTELMRVVDFMRVQFGKTVENLGPLFLKALPYIIEFATFIVTVIAKAIGSVVDTISDIVKIAAVVFRTITDIVSFAVRDMIAFFEKWKVRIIGIYNEIKSTVLSVLDLVKTGVTTALDFVLNMIQKIKDKITGLIETITGGLNSIKGFLGLGEIKISNELKGKLPESVQGKTESGLPQSGLPEKQSINNVYSLIPKSGIIGKAGTSNQSNQSTTTNSTNITGTQIHIKTSDPAKAGESVKKELERMNKRTIRNGQTSVVS